MACCCFRNNKRNTAAAGKWKRGPGGLLLFPESSETAMAKSNKKLAQQLQTNKKNCNKQQEQYSSEKENRQCWQNESLWQTKQPASYLVTRKAAKESSETAQKKHKLVDEWIPRVNCRTKWHMKPHLALDKPFANFLDTEWLAAAATAAQAQCCSRNNKNHTKKAVRQRQQKGTSTLSYAFR